MLGLISSALGRQTTPATFNTHHALAEAPRREVRPLVVIQLAGSQEEMGAQHGQIVRDLGGFQATLDYYPQLVQSLILGAFAPGQEPPLLGRLLDLVVDRLLGQMDRQRPESYRRRSAAFFDALGGGDPRSVMVMDLFQNVIGALTRMGLTKFAKRFGPALPPACSSVTVWGAASADGQLRHARNFDFPGIGIWDRAPSVVFCRPDSGIPYGFVSTHGGDVPAVSAFNEAGLVVTTHTRLHRDITFSGAAITDMLHDVVQHAESLDDAARILGRRRVASSWGILVSSARERRALVMETTAAGVARLDPAGDEAFMTCTNRYKAPVNQEREVTTTFAWPTNSDGRQRRLTLAAREAARGGGFDTGQLCALLGSSQSTPGGTEHPAGNVLAQPVAVQSIVAEPESAAIHVSVGTAPTGWGPYRRVEWRWSGQAGYEVLAPSDDQIKATRDAEGSPFRSAYRHFRQAVRLQINEHNVPAARYHLEQACAKSPAQSRYRFCAGAYQLQQGDLKRALRHFRVGIEHEDAPFYRGNLLLWASRTADALGDRQLAASYRSQLLAIADPNLQEHHELARVEQRRPFDPRRLRKLTVNLILCDATA